MCVYIVLSQVRIEWKHLFIETASNILWFMQAEFGVPLGVFLGSSLDVVSIYFFGQCIYNFRCNTDGYQCSFDDFQNCINVY